MKIVLATNIRVPGLHRWPDAPFPVNYLAHRHRHLFHIEACRQVKDADREIEFIVFQQEVRTWLDISFPRRPCGSYDFGTRSCEQLAILMIQELKLQQCSVFEDGENGATVFA